MFIVIPLDFTEIYMDFIWKQIEHDKSNAKCNYSLLQSELDQATEKLMQCHDQLIMYRQSDVALSLVKLCLEKLSDDNSNFKS